MSQIIFDLDKQTAEKLNTVIKNFENENLFADNFISLHINKLKRENRKIEIELNDFEIKYNMSSLDFFDKFENGSLPDSQDFILWSGIYQMYDNNKNILSKLS